MNGYDVFIGRMPLKARRSCLFHRGVVSEYLKFSGGVYRGTFRGDRNPQPRYKPCNSIYRWTAWGEKVIATLAVMTPTTDIGSRDI